MPYRGKRNEPSYIPLVAAKVAELCGLTMDDVAAITTRNAEELFSKLSE
jgi:TatD DNase family protein